MAYSAVMRAGIGAVRSALAGLGLGPVDGRFLEHGEHDAPADAPLVLVACSGGRDSMALAGVARVVCAAWGLRCGAVIVDHGLQEVTATVARDTAVVLRGLGLSLVQVREVRVKGMGRGMEAAAREARYAALDEAASELGAVTVLLAHTRDDQAETVLIDLMRSSGVDAVAGMPSRFERGTVTYLRPLLALTRADTTALCRDLGLAWWDDPTNGDSGNGSDGDGDNGDGGNVNSATAKAAAALPLRSRVRHDLLPHMTGFFGGDVARHLAEGSTLARLEKDYLDGEAERVARSAVVFNVAAVSAGKAAPSRPEADCNVEVTTAGNDIGETGETRDAGGSGETLRFHVAALAAAHPAIRLRVIAHALAETGVSATLAQIRAIDALACQWHGQGAVSLPSGYSANRKKHVILVCQDGTHANR